MSGALLIYDDAMEINLSSGSIIKIGTLSDTHTFEAKLAPLSTEEKLYGRGLCLLPEGWECLTGEACWITQLSDELRQNWLALSREHRMSIAHI